jgi:hypothetical protein
MPPRNPEQFTVADGLKQRRCSVAILHIGRMNKDEEHDAQRARSERHRRGPFHRVDAVRWSGAYAAAPAK